MAVIVDLNLVCIICLQDDGGELVSVYSDDGAITEVQDTAPKVTLAEKIALCSSLNLADINIKLSNQICTSCLEDLEAAWRFRKNCETSNSLYQSIQQEELEDVISLANYQPDDEKEIKQALKLSHPRKHAETKLSISSTPKEDKKPYNIISEIDPEKTRDDLESFESYGIVEYVDEEDQKDTDYFDCVREEMLEEADDDNFDDVHKSDHLKEEKQQTFREKNRVKIKEEMKEETEFLLDEGDAQEEEANEKENNVADDLIEESLTNFKGSSNIKNLSTLKSKAAKKSSTKKGKSLHGSAKICEVCGNIYKYQHALTAHMRRHNNDRQFGCELCEKAFVSNVELQRHMRVHTGVKPYPCSFCERRFSDFGSRSKHERTHTGERPYKCTTCHKSFAYPHVLTVHLRTHTGEKKFQCTRCGRGFTKKAYLLTHLENHERCESISLVIDGQQQQEVTEIKTVALEECIFTTINENDDMSDKLQNIIMVEHDNSDQCTIELEEAIDEEHLDEETSNEEYILGMRS